MKKIISFLSIFLILFLNFSSVFSFYNNTTQYQNNNLVKNSWISSKSLIKIILNKWFSPYWIKKFLDIRWVTIQDIRNLRYKSKVEKIKFIKKLFSTWLSYSQINEIKSVNWFTNNWLNLLKKFKFQTQLNNNFISSNTKNINTNFLSKLKNNVYKINYTNIIPWKNAWKVQATFVWKQNLPSKFILEKGFSYELNSKALDKNLVKNNNLLKQINFLKTKWIDFWKVNIKESKLELLPDRMVYSKNIEINFKNDNQFNNIKKYLKDYFDPNKLKQTNKNFDKKYVNISWKAQVISTKDFNKNLILACKNKAKQLWKNVNKCNNLDYKNLWKKITFSDKVNISLIPITIEDVENKNIFINKDPKKINISKQEILKRFDLLKEIKLQKNLALKNAEMNWPIPKHNMNDPKYCDIYYDWELKQAQSAKDNYKINKVNKKIENCKKKQKEVNKITTSKYAQDFLNWFTIWEQKSYDWSTSISVDTYAFWTIDIFDFDFSFYYLYAVWLRIPFKVNWEVKDSELHDYSEVWKKPKTDYETKINIKAVNWDANYYRNIWIPEKHIYDWKEFVLKFSSGIKLHVWTPITGHIKYEVKLVSLLVKKIENELKRIWITQKQINYFKDNNIIDLSKDFTTPFWWKNIIKLLTLETWPYIVFSVYGIDLLWNTWVDVGLDWRITVKCETINSEWWCPKWDSSSSVQVWLTESSINIWNDPSRIHINWNKTYIWKGKAIFNSDNSIQDELWRYSKFWVLINDFRYHPILLFTLFTYVGVWVPDVPYIWDLVVWSPKINLYTIKFSSDSLYLKTHEWTKWDFDMSEKNKIYSTSSTLKPISSIEVYRKWKSIKKFTPRSILDIKPYSNTINWNSVFYRNDWVYPQCDVNIKNKLYYPNSLIWPEAKDELVNNKMLNIKAIACDMFSKNNPNSRKTYHKNVLINTKNYYHKPVLANLITQKCIDPNSNSNKNYRNSVSYYEYDPNYLKSKNKNLLQEERQELNFKMPLNRFQEWFIKIIWHPENTDSFYKYNFVSKNPKKFNSLKFNLWWTSNLANNISLNTDKEDICNNDNLWTKYNWEIFVAWDNSRVYSLIPEKWETSKRIYFNEDKILKVVKCIKKPNWKYFQSLETKAIITMVDNIAWICWVSDTPINQNWWLIHLNEKMKKDLVDPVFNIQNQFNWSNLQNKLTH